MAPTPERSKRKPNLFVRKPRKQIAEHFHRALHIALQDDVQFLGAGGLDLLGQSFQRYARTLGQRGFAGFLLAVFGDAARLVAIRDNNELISSLRQTFHAQNFNRRGRRRGLKRRSAIVEHGANFAVDVAHHKVVAGNERAVLHQHRGHRSAAAIEFRFEHHARRSALRSRLQLRQIRDQADHFHQQVQIRFLLRRNVDEDRLAAPLFRHQAAIGELLLHAVGHCVGLIDLVHGDDDRNFGGVRVIDRFHGLRHDAVIGSDDQHHNVGGFRSARPHAGKRFVTRRIEEYDLAPEGRRFLVGNANFVGADVLRDASRFAFGNAGQANRVEQRGLAVVDVTHDRDHRRTRRNFDGRLFSARRGCVNVFRSLLFERDHVRLGAEEARHFAGQFGVERLVDRGENAATQAGARSNLSRECRASPPDLLR